MLFIMVNCVCLVYVWFVLVWFAVYFCVLGLFVWVAAFDVLNFVFAMYLLIAFDWCFRIIRFKLLSVLLLVLFVCLFTCFCF